MANKFTIYRVTVSTDTPTSPAESIVCNDPTDSDLKHGAIDGGSVLLTNLVKEVGHSIADPQPAEQNIGSLQPLGVGDVRYTLTIKVKDANKSSGVNPNIVQFEAWVADPLGRNTDWPEGRFGTIDTNDISNTEVVDRIGTEKAGMVIEYYKKETNLKSNQAIITLILRRSVGDGQ